MRALKNRAATCLTSFATPALVAAVVCTSAQLPMLTDHRIRQAAYAYVPTATIDTSSTTVGISDSDLYGMTDAEISTALDTMVSMGVTTVRVLIPWAGIEVLNNVYNWNEMDSIVNAAASRGISVLGVITSSPWWASSTSLISVNSAPTSVDEYAQFAAAVAERYGAASNGGDAKISALEIWNEPNSITGYYPGPDASSYTDLLKAAYTAIKAVDSSMSVIGGVVGSVSTFSTLTENPVKFIAAMYAAGAAGYFDALSFHPYQYTMPFSSGENYGSSALDEGYASSPIEQYLAIRALMDANGDTAKQIWATEYGLPTSVVSEADQAAFIKDFLATWSALTGSGPMYFYTLVDKATGSTNAEDNFGLYNTDGTPKDAVAVIMSWIQEHLSTGGDGSTGTGSSGTATNPLQALADAVTAYFQQITASFQNAVNQFTSAVNNAITNAQNFFKQIAANFQNVIKTIQSWFGVTPATTQDSAEPTTTATATNATTTALKVAAETAPATTDSATTPTATDSATTTTAAVTATATTPESTTAAATVTAPLSSATTEATAPTTETSTATPVSSTPSTAATSAAGTADPTTDNASTATDSTTPATGTKTSTTTTGATSTTDETSSGEKDSDTTSSSKSDEDATDESKDSTTTLKTTTSTSSTSSSTSVSKSDESTSTAAKNTVASSSDTSTGSASKTGSTNDTPSTTSHTEASSKAA